MIHNIQENSQVTIKCVNRHKNTSLKMVVYEVGSEKV